MKFILAILFYLAIFKLSLSFPVEDVLEVNVRQKKLKTNLERSSSVQYAPTGVKTLEAASIVNNLYEGQNSNPNEEFFLKTNSLGKAEKFSKISHIRTQPSYENTKENHTSTTGEMKEYFFLSDAEGTIIIIDNKYNIITSRKLPDIAYGIGAIVNDKFYNIDTMKGQIISTDIENLMTSGNTVKWDIVGEFPNETYYIREQVAVNESSIYFVTFSGNLYSYNITSKYAKRIGKVEVSTYYASLLIVDKILYIYKHKYFYSFDGITLKEIATPLKRNFCGLFERRGHVCRLGGNLTDTLPDPVSCYDPTSNKWNIDATTMYYYMSYPGIAIARLGVYVFGEYVHMSNGTQLWGNTCYVLNPDNFLLVYIPCPFTKAPFRPQAISFLH